MITLHIEAATPSELVRKALAELGFNVEAQVAISVRELSAAAPLPAADAPAAVETSSSVAPSSEAQGDAQRRRGRPRKATPAEASVSAAQEAVAQNTSSTPAASTPAAEAAPAPVAAAQQAVVTDAEMIELAQKLAQHASVRAVTAILHELGVNRVKEVPADKRPVFVAKVKEALAQPAP